MQKSQLFNVMRHSRGLSELFDESFVEPLRSCSKSEDIETAKLARGMYEGLKKKVRRKLEADASKVPDSPGKFKALAEKYNRKVSRLNKGLARYRSKAIYRDFKIPKSRIKRQIHAKEKTLSFEISVTDLLPNSGPSRIFYIFGYQSKKLIQVNLVWGRPVTDSPDAKSIVNTANQLRDHFMQKNFPEKGRLVNAPLKDGSILVFRGQDKRGRLTTLLLMNPEVEGSSKNENISLRLSYIEDPDSPDIFRVRANDF